MSDSIRTGGGTPSKEVQDELSISSGSGGTTPGNSLPISSLSFSGRVVNYALRHKAATGLGLTTLVFTGALTLDQTTGAISAAIFPKIFKGEILTRTVTITPPAVGPIDIELGYNRIADLRKKWAEEDGNIVTPQKPWSQHYLIPGISFRGRVLREPRLIIPPVFKRPEGQGLKMIDADGKALIDIQKDVYRDIGEVPSVIIRALTRAEGLGSVDVHGILDPEKPGTTRDSVRLAWTNHAIDWPRFMLALGQNAEKSAARLLGLHLQAPGASTPAVQTVKNWAWENGRTKTGSDKFAQMGMASIWAYRYGADTTVSRSEDFVTYLNTVSFGRHRGLKEAMAYFYGNTTYNDDLKDGITDAKSAMAFRQVLTLIMALPNPSTSMLTEAGYADVTQRADNFLSKAFVKDGVLTQKEADLVLATHFPFEQLGKNPVVQTTETSKPVLALENRLLMKMRMGQEPGGRYQLEKYDLEVHTTNYGEVEQQLLEKIRSFKDPETAKANGLVGIKLLSPQSTPYDFDVSIDIKQITPEGLALNRVNIDTAPGEHNLNSQGRINTGSTNKFLMLGTLEQFVFAELWDEYNQKTPEELESAKAKVSPKDPLTRFALDYLTNPATEKTLTGLLDAATQIKYSGALACFFTGEGMNCPHNYESKENGQSYTVADALAQSVNLSWYRITQAIQEHVKYHKLKINPEVLNPNSQDQEALQQRQQYLRQFAQHEGGVYLGRAFVAMRKNPDIRSARLADSYFTTTQQPPSYEGMVQAISKPCETRHECNTDEKYLKGLYEAHMAQPKESLQAQAIVRFLAAKSRPTGAGLASVIFSVLPHTNFSQFSDFMKEQGTGKAGLDTSDEKLRKLFAAHAPRPMANIAAIIPALSRSRDGSLEETNHLAAFIQRTPKPSDPDAARSWFSPEEQLAALYGKRHPGSDYENMRDFIIRNCKTCRGGDFKALHATYKDGTYDAAAMIQPFSLQDRAFLAKLHPMKLESGRLIAEQPELRLEGAMAQTEESRVKIYNSWLINPKKLTDGKIRAQNRAITIMMDRDAWGEIEGFWHKIGYPKEYHLVPSLASVIGVSGNKPEALSKFTSIILHGGENVRITPFTDIHFGTGADNPHELHARPGLPAGPRILHPEVAEHLIKMARGGVENEQGTSRRLFGVFKNQDGSPAVTFGKTGTAADSSTGKFRGAFWMGGTAQCYAITIGVYKDNARPTDKYTSALASQILKALAPEIQPMLDRAGCSNPLLQGTPEKRKKMADAPATSDASGTAQPERQIAAESQVAVPFTPPEQPDQDRPGLAFSVINTRIPETNRVFSINPPQPPTEDAPGFGACTSAPAGSRMPLRTPCPAAP